MMRRLLTGLRRDENGATIIEFGIVMPVFAVMLMGIFDLGYQVYMQSTLTGAVQQAGRDSALETGESEQEDIDERVTRQVRKLNKNAVVNTTRTSYFDYAGVGQAESYDDDNGNGEYDEDSECFEDVNDNATWDEDIGEDGFGGPSDVVLYRVSVEYDRIFPMYGLLGWSQTNEVTAATVLKNQPYGDQTDQTIEVVCP